MGIMGDKTLTLKESNYDIAVTVICDRYRFICIYGDVVTVTSRVVDRSRFVVRRQKNGEVQVK